METQNLSVCRPLELLHQLCWQAGIGRWRRTANFPPFHPPHNPPGHRPLRAAHKYVGRGPTFPGLPRAAQLLLATDAGAPYQAFLEQRTPSPFPRLPTLACREVQNTHRRWNILASTLSATRRYGTSHRAPTLQAHILWCLPHPVTFGAVSLLSVSANVLHPLHIDDSLQFSQ